MRWAAVLIVGMVLARASDAAITYSITPDLSAEQNVLKVWGNATWALLLTLNAVVVAAAAVIVWRAHRLRPQLLPAQPGLSRKEFAAQYYFGDNRPFRDMMWHFPTGKHNILVFGALLPAMLIAISLVVDLSHLAALPWPEYARMHNAVVTRIWAQVIAAWAVSGLSAHLAWRIEYRLYLRQT